MGKPLENFSMQNWSINKNYTILLTLDIIHNIHI